MYLLFDIGGTNTRVALSRDGINVVNVESFPTPPVFEDGLKEIERFVGKVEGKIEATSGGFPGTCDKKKGTVLRAPNLPGWIDENLKERLSQITNSPVFLANDADLAGLGEAIEGAGKDFNIVAYITISTGVGGVRIVNKKIDAATIGFEPGHQIIDADTSIRSEYIEAKKGDNPSYLEDFVSGKSIEIIYGEKAEDIDNPNVWDEIHWLLSVGLNNTIVHWSPEIIVIGGKVGRSEKISLSKLNFHLSKYVKIFPTLPILKKSELGDKAGLVGALHYLKQNS